MALSMPLALRAASSFFEEGASRPDRSRPLAFLGGAFLFPAVGFEGRDSSSSRRRASFSAFLRAASSALAAAASLHAWVRLVLSLE